ncbi:hypothetical protein MMC2321_00662 [Chitinophaga sp. MM2321]
MQPAFFISCKNDIIGIIISYLAAAAESTAGAIAAESTTASAAGASTGGAAFIVSTVVAVESAAGVLPPLQATKNIPAAIANTNTFFIFMCVLVFKTGAKVLNIFRIQNLFIPFLPSYYFLRKKIFNGTPLKSKLVRI